MNKEKFYLEAKDFNREMFHMIPQIRFEWNMLYSCNYNCRYRFFYNKWEEYEKRNVFLPVKEWKKVWERIYEFYGSVSLVITGGEPFLYPNFIHIIKEISSLHYPIHISTNGSGDLEGFAKEIDPEKVYLSLSFHLEFDALEEVINRKKYLSTKGFLSPYICFCIYPPFFKKLDEYIEQANKKNEKLKIIPFVGEYNGKAYPDAYTIQEKDELGLDEVWEKNVKRRGTLCAAGMKSALILPDGKVVRCGHIGEKFIIGNFFSEDFKLLDKPLICEAEICSNLATVLVE